jgi:hypothetical protein
LEDKTMTRLRLTPQLRSQIVAGIRSGGYALVAAEAFGVPRAVFEDWVRRGTGKAAREPYGAFAGDVRTAQAQARLRAELAVFADDPKVWLEHGPGRETADRPGWTVAAKPAGADPDGRNALLDPQCMRVCDVLLDALLPFPDARGVAGDAVAMLQRAA